MNPQDILDYTPMIVVFVTLVVASAAFVVVGYWIGRWWQDRMPDESEGPAGSLVASVLALMSFLIAITMAMAADRFDTRRTLVVDEANSILTTYLRAGFLPNQQRDEVRDLLREYVPLRVNVADRTQLLANFARSTQIHRELWAKAEAVQMDSETFSLFADSLNETINLHEKRVAAIVYARVPETVLLVLLVGSALTLSMFGFGGGLTGRPSLFGTTVLIIVFAILFTLIIDLDRPRGGFLQVSQQPLIDLQEKVVVPLGE